jgi:hypothetical protein
MTLPVWAPYALSLGSQIAGGFGSYLEGRNQRDYQNRVLKLQEEAQRKRAEAEAGAAGVNIWFGLAGRGQMQPVYEKPPEIPEYESSGWGTALRGLGTGMSYAGTALQGWNSFKQLSAAQAKQAGADAARADFLKNAREIPEIGSTVPGEVYQPYKPWQMGDPAPQPGGFLGEYLPSAPSTQTAAGFYRSVLNTIDPDEGAKQAEGLYSGLLADTQKDHFKAGYNTFLDAQRSEVTESLWKAQMHDQKMAFDLLKFNTDKEYRDEHLSILRDAQNVDGDPRGMPEINFKQKFMDNIHAKMTDPKGTVGALQANIQETDKALARLLEDKNITWGWKTDPQTGEPILINGQKVWEITSGTISGATLNSFRSYYRRAQTNEQITVADIEQMEVDLSSFAEMFGKTVHNTKIELQNLWNMLGGDEDTLTEGSDAYNDLIKMPNYQANALVNMLLRGQANGASLIEQNKTQLASTDVFAWSQDKVAMRALDFYDSESLGAWIDGLYDGSVADYNDYFSLKGTSAIPGDQGPLLDKLDGASITPFDETFIARPAAPKKTFEQTWGDTSGVLNWFGGVSSNSITQSGAINPETQNRIVNHNLGAQHSARLVDYATPQDYASPGLKRDIPSVARFTNSLLNWFDTRALEAEYVEATGDTNPVGRTERARAWGLSLEGIR